jgi:hypothetical protein
LKLPENENASRKGGVQTVEKTLGCIEGPQPFDFNSAGGGVYVAEEQQNVASYINLRP